MSTLDDILETDSAIDGTGRGDYEVAGNEYSVRRLLIDIERLERRHDRLMRLRQEIANDYMAAAMQVEEQIKAARQLVRDYIENINGGEALHFPDVGTAYLTKTGTRLVVEDADKFEAWAQEMGHVQPDVSTAMKQARAQFKETGEIPHGCAVEPGVKTLAVKKP